jgi:hypothetical protein
MDETEQAIVDLQAYRAMLVAARRKLVSLGVTGNKNQVRAPGAAYEMSVGPNIARSAEIRTLQDDIDAVNRAIQDERDSLVRLPQGQPVA